MTLRTYSKMISLPTFKDRLEYLQLNGKVGEDTFGFDRYINQRFYRSVEWRRIRDQIILRDNGCDLAVDGMAIYGRAIIHHMNPISVTDIVDATEFLLNPEFLVCVTPETHNAIHYGVSNLVLPEIVERTPNDTCPWKR